MVLPVDERPQNGEPVFTDEYQPLMLLALNAVDTMEWEGLHGRVRRDILPCRFCSHCFRRERFLQDTLPSRWVNFVTSSRSTSRRRHHRQRLHLLRRAGDFCFCSGSLIIYSSVINPYTLEAFVAFVYLLLGSIDDDVKNDLGAREFSVCVTTSGSVFRSALFPTSISTWLREPFVGLYQRPVRQLLPRHAAR